MQDLGRMIEVDLTGKTVTSSKFTKELALELLGGFGFNIRYLYRELRENTGPLQPDNILIVSLGLLTGTSAPSSSRVHINALSPLSGLIGSSSLGGSLGLHLRSLGIVSLIFRGASPGPVFIRINEEGVQILDATDLWGLDTRQTESALQARFGKKKIEILSIGAAGENHVRYACIMAGIDHSAGHSGMGAVMGSKNLKAICVQGIGGQQNLSSESRQIIREYTRDIQNNVSRYYDFSQLGSAGDVLELNELGLLGTRNYQSMQVEDADRIDGRNLKSYVIKKVTCPGCPVHCKAEVELKEGKYKGFRGGRPEYETVIDLGALCGLTDPDALMYVSNLSNMLGLDTISTGSVIAFAMDLYARGIITKKDTDGLDLTWGNAEAMEELMTNIAHRRGIGNLLAGGVLRAAKKIGKGSEKYAYHVKGVEIYGSDPRGMMGTALAYAVSMRGGDFTSVYPVPEFRYSQERAEKEFGTIEAVDRLATGGKGALVRYCMIVSSVIDSIGICKVPALSIAGNYDLEKETMLVRSITGLDINTEQILYIGERIIHMEKLFNIRFGATDEQDTLPELFLEEPIAEGPSKGAKVNLEPMVQDFYLSMGWDENGVPLKSTLNKFKLSLDVVGMDDE